MPTPAPHRPETPRNRLVRQAREFLAVAREFGDTEDEQRALNRLAALGVDEAGDDVAPREQSWRGTEGL